MNQHKHIALFTSSLSGGGAEAVLINLAKEFIKRNIIVDLLVCKHSGPLTREIPDNLNIIELKKDNRIKLFFCFLKLPPRNWPILILSLFSKKPKSFYRILSLKKYIHESKPDILLSCLNSVNITSLWVKHITHSDTIFIIQQVNLLSKSITEENSIFKKKSLPQFVKHWYKTADVVISVTDAVKEDLILNFQLENNKITTIHNPLNLKEIRLLASAQIHEPWLHEETPVILAVGRLCKVKNYPFLLEVVKKINQFRLIKLIILGEGPEKSSLEKLIINLGLQDKVKMLGYKQNPYKYMKNADIFTLTSNSEGLGNVLQEALACGCKIVSTNCPGGPSEILANGKFGRLTPENDILTMALAILYSIDTSVDVDMLYSRASDFSSNKIVNQYLNLFSNLKRLPNKH